VGRWRPAPGYPRGAAGGWQPSAGANSPAVGRL